ncbi:flagellar type III secretion system protein FliR [Paenibacillus hunanensis]|uniref:flagellar biosynthetic protein FliR n=1 Tax=Paenibacillus hunanensis TaxID=539262 RepID=UPI002025CF61|nr:flagellar biosynthetic protein FliR [Paenibacillus hunanensis]MCL9660179.1 flagellar type III secretion system protein FliR [Paenibacillus hunanensis]
METLLQSFPVFLLIFCRMTAFFVVSPIFSSRGVPNQFKVGIAAFISLLIYLIKGTTIKIPDGTDIYVLMVFREILIGLLLGYIAYLMFMVIQIAGSFIDIQIGLGIASVFDPMTGASAPVIGNFKYMFAMLIFLSMNGHHYLLQSVLYSYDWVPMNSDIVSQMLNGSLSEFLIRTFTNSFLIAFQMSAPIVVATFLTDVGLGFLARSAPQFNIFVIGVPVKIIVGLFVLMLLTPSFAFIFEHLFEQMFQAMQGLLQVLGKRPAS